MAEAAVRLAVPVAVAIDVGGGGRHAADVLVDARDEFAERHCLPALRMNALAVPGSALVAPLVARHLVAAARTHGATAVAHDRATDLVTAYVAELAPDLDVAGQAGSRRNLWAYAADAYDPPDPDELVVTFDRGTPVAVDGETVTALQAFQQLNHRAGAHGVGHPTPGAAALVTAHRALEAATLTPDLAGYKQEVERCWADLVRAGRWFSPLRTALEAFAEESQRHVSGEVRMVLHDGGARALPMIVTTKEVHV